MEKTMRMSTEALLNDPVRRLAVAAILGSWIRQAPSRQNVSEKATAERCEHLLQRLNGAGRAETIVAVATASMELGICNESGWIELHGIGVDGFLASRARRLNLNTEDYVN